MNCENYPSLILELVENKLDAPTADEVLAHLTACEICETEFQALFDGQEIYPNLLCEVLPSSDLSAKFRAQLESEESDLRLTTGAAFGVYQQLSKSLAFFRLNAALTTAAILVLLALGFGFFKFVGNWSFVENTRLLSAISENPRPTLPQRKAARTNPNAPAPVSGQTKKPAIAGLNNKAGKAVTKLIAGQQPAIKKTDRNPEIRAKTIQLSAEEQNQIAQIQGLEIDAARQIEKIELLLRAFRNARSIEENGPYDVTYEKRQARNLLRSNVGLKQRAESYGTLLTEEMLNKVEPYLLDIANLDSRPSCEQIVNIKDRLRKQNIIAELQNF